MIQQIVKCSSVILFLFVFSYLSLLLFAPNCGWLMAQIWHKHLKRKYFVDAPIIETGKDFDHIFCDSARVASSQQPRYWEKN
jgi:hypothetical protein